MKNKKSQSQEGQRIPSMIIQKKHTPKHISVRLLKTKDKENFSLVNKNKMNHYISRKMNITDSYLRPRHRNSNQIYLTNSTKKER